MSKRKADTADTAAETAAHIAAANKRGRAAGERAVSDAKARGLTIINHGAGTMPVSAAAPHGGTRYTLLQDDDAGAAAAADDETQNKNVNSSRAPPHDGVKDAHGKLSFADAPDFRPSLTPAECIAKGVFGGCYFNPRGGKPGIFGPTVAIDHKEFPASWFEGVDPQRYLSRRYHVPTNAYGVKSGFGQKEWEAKGWMHAQDPRGWFQWYCRFYCGRRTSDDARQIQRWCACASERGRWRNQLCGAIAKAGPSRRFDDTTISPVIRQTLLHWAFELSEADYEGWRERQKGKK